MDRISHTNFKVFSLKNKGKGSLNMVANSQLELLSFYQADNNPDTYYYNKFSYMDGAQTFAVPSTLKVQDIRLNKAPLDLIDDYTIAGTTLTILTTLEANDQVVVIGTY